MLVLHTCCAVCALPIIEHLLKKRNNSDILLFFSNSNIYPFKEYEKRLENVKKIANYYKLEIKSDNYFHQEWLNYLKQNLPLPPQDYSENSLRCLKCFEFRLKKTVEFTKENNFKEFATTLSVSLYKDTSFINQFAQKLAQENQLEYVKINLEPQLAKKESLLLTKKLNIYRQKYCGCEFSLNK